MREKQTPTGSRTLQYPKRFDKIQERNHAIRLGSQLHDDAIVAHVHDFRAELVREDREGLQVLVF